MAPKKSELPSIIRPQLVTMMSQPPSGEWLYEIKFDGYRMMVRLDGNARLFTKNGYDWTDRMPALAREFSCFNVRSAWIDGEVVVQDDEGMPKFQALQSAFSSRKTSDLIFFAFDLLYLDGVDLRHEPVEVRRDKLRQLVGANPHDHIRFSETLDVDPAHLLINACKMELEGIVGKRRGSAYASERNGDWIKLKCHSRQEFVVVGYTRAAGGIGSLLLGLHDDSGELAYAGRVKSGFTNKALIELAKKIRSLEIPTCILKEPPTLGRGNQVVWLKPVLVCEVKFAEITPNGRVRHPVFLGMREDKPAEGISLESSVPDRPPEPKSKKIRITHGERIIDPASGLTKRDLVDYYARIAERLLPMLEDRPVSLARAPDGIAGEQFFQRSPSGLAIPEIETIQRPSGKTVMVINSQEALLSAIQMGSVEIHTWNATGSDLSRPDRFILDLDPDTDLPWIKMVEATQLVMTVLTELGLESFLKTSGGKGVHIVVPISPRDDWASMKAFTLAIAKYLSRLIPERFTSVSGPKNRVGRIFIDYLRNGEGATTVCAYSARAREGLPVSVPIWPEELEALAGASNWSIQSVFERLDRQGDDPWAGMDQVRQVITKKMRAQIGR
jgi:bifunctional non-homologous end joining protein LigD